MDIVFAVWFAGSVLSFVALIIATVMEPPHGDDDFVKTYKSWGGTRFYTVWFLGWFIACLIWPIVVFSLYITALVKKW